MWSELMTQLAVPTSTTNYPMFGVVEGKAEDHQTSYRSRREPDEQVQEQRQKNPAAAAAEMDEAISEDFIFL